jgi:hypothetical protein
MQHDKDQAKERLEIIEKTTFNHSPLSEDGL